MQVVYTAVVTVSCQCSGLVKMLLLFLCPQDALPPTFTVFLLVVSIYLKHTALFIKVAS